MPVTGNTLKIPDSVENAKIPVTGNNENNSSYREKYNSAGYREQHKQSQLQRTIHTLPATGNNAKLIIDNPMFLLKLIIPP